MEFLKAPTLLLVILGLTICSPISAQNKGGYWPTWAQDSFPPSNIQTAYFTHVYYAFLSLNNVTFQFDIDATTASALNSFNTALHAKNPPVKTLFSIGGGTDGEKEPSKELSKMAASANSRASFIRSTIQVARNYGFDGADLDWEYPQTQTDMNNFGLLLDEWRVAINNEATSSGKPRLLLSAATRYKSEVTDSGVAKYPVASINKNLDWINAMCYDYHGYWTPDATGAPAALYDPNGDLSTSNGLQSWISAGIQRQKLVMGMPLFGRTWKLKNPSVNGIGAPAAGIGPGKGAMLYSEVQQFNAQNNSKVVYDPQTVSYYSYAGASWIGYDDVNSVQRKVQYAKSLNIGGYFFWTAVGDQDWKISRLASQTWTT